MILYNSKNQIRTNSQTPRGFKFHCIVLLNYDTIEELHNGKLFWLKANQRELEDKEFKNTELFWGSNRNSSFELLTRLHKVLIKLQVTNSKF